jgi:hypothetical protein
VGLLTTLGPTIATAALARLCVLVWATQPRLQRSEGLRVALIVSTVGMVAFGLIAAVDIFARVITFGIDDAFSF